MPNVVVDNEYVTMVYRPDLNAIHHTFHQTTMGEVLRDAFEAGLGSLRQQGADKWLADDRKNSRVTPEHLEWSMNDWGPRVAAAGWKHWALVVPENIAGRADMSGMVEHFWKLGVRINVFTSVEDAEDWLRSV